MLSIFRTNQVLTGVLLLPYAFLLYASVFILPATDVPDVSSGVLGEWFSNLLISSPILSNIIAGLLLTLQSFLINLIAIEHRLQNDLTLFPGLFYILLCCCIPDFLGLSPVLIGNTFFIIAVGQVMNSYKKTPVAGHIFNVGFWLGLASLFYFSFIFLIFWGIIAVSSLRNLKLKEIFQNSLGMLAVYILTGTYYYKNGSFSEFWQRQFTSNLSFWDFETGGQMSTWVNGGIVALLVVLAVLSYNTFLSKKSMQVQRKINVLFQALFILTITMVFQESISISHLLIFMVPLSFFTAFYFSGLKRSVAESLHFILLMAILAYQFSPLFLTP